MNEVRPESLILSYLDDERDSEPQPPMPAQAHKPRGKSLIAQRPKQIPPIRSTPVQQSALPPLYASQPMPSSMQHRPQQPQSQRNPNSPSKQRPVQVNQSPMPRQQMNRPPPSYTSQRPQLQVQVQAPMPIQQKAPPRAAFSSSPTETRSFSPGSPSPAMLGPVIPRGVVRKGSFETLNEKEDDRFGAASAVGSNAPAMDFWKRFSMVVHDAQAEKATQSKDTWLRRQTQTNSKWKIIIWSLALIILIAIGGALAYHFTHRSNDASKTPSQHDFGLGPGSSSSANPLASVAVTRNVDMGPRDAIPIFEPVITGVAKMHKIRRRTRT